MDNITFIEKYCVIKNKTTNKTHKIKLSNVQKCFIRFIKNINYRGDITLFRTKIKEMKCNKYNCTLFDSFLCEECEDNPKVSTGYWNECPNLIKD